MRYTSFFIVLISLGMAPFEHSYCQEVYVVSSQPRFVTTNQRQCDLETVRVDNRESSALIGGIAGGMIGNQLAKAHREILPPLLVWSLALWLGTD